MPRLRRNTWKRFFMKYLPCLWKNWFRCIFCVLLVLLAYYAGRQVAMTFRDNELSDYDIYEDKHCVFNAEPGLPGRDRSIPKNPVPAIYFVDWTEDKMDLTSAEACAVMSAAMHHPDTSVVLLYASPELDERSPNLAILLHTLPNIRATPINQTELFCGTILEDWHRDKRILEVARPKEVRREAVRTTLLFKYGGIYLDLDVIVLKSIIHLRNVIAYEKAPSRNLGSAVMIFDARHAFIFNLMVQISLNFEVQVNEGLTFTTFLYTYFCLRVPGGRKNCGKINLLPSKAFYPFSPDDWRHGSNVWTPTGTGVDLGQSYAVHLFSMTGDITVASGYGILTEYLARRNCPDIYERMLPKRTF